MIHLALGQLIFSLSFIGHHTDSKITGTGSKWALLPHRTALCGPCIAAIDGFGSLTFEERTFNQSKCIKSILATDTRCHVPI